MVGAATKAKEVLGKQLEDKPAIERWMNELAARPGVQRGMAIEPPQKSQPLMPSDPGRLASGRDARPA
jgi:hypothetical protein